MQSGDGLTTVSQSLKAFTARGLDGAFDAKPDPGRGQPVL